MKPRLTIELVPTTCWYSNVRSEVSTAEWDYLRRGCYSRARWVCEVCGGQGPKWPVECHEVWRYFDTTHVQKLVRLIALCPACHEVKHIGRAEATGRGEAALRHLMQVNEWSRSRAQAYIQRSYGKWNDRSEFEWELDISWLEKRLDRIPHRGTPRRSTT